MDMPSKAIEMLMDEHKVILMVLGSLESMADALEKGEQWSAAPSKTTLISCAILPTNAITARKKTGCS